MDTKPLTKEQLISVIDGNPSVPRVPFDIHGNVNLDSFGDARLEIETILKKYPEDVQTVMINQPGMFPSLSKDSNYCWLPYENPSYNNNQSHDNKIAMENWDFLPEILSEFPDASSKLVFKDLPEVDTRYRLGLWKNSYFERLWKLRGMENALTDFYLFPEQVQQLFDKMTDFYIGIIQRVGKEKHFDGMLFTDDIGMQTGAFFSLDIFKQFLKPYYKRIFAACHENNLHAWLHSCGDVSSFLESLAEINLDVLHPIQKNTMDQEKTAQDYRGQFTFHAGMDMQNILPFGSTEDVRREVRFLIDTFWDKSRGQCIFTVGNGVNNDCPPENLEAMLSEALEYGTKIINEK